jgi:hypothetical protein
MRSLGEAGTMGALDDTPQARVAMLRQALHAHAAGLWRLGGGDRLEQVAFDAGPEVSTEVARAFGEATRSVPLTQANLGIVRAFVDGETCIARAAELPEENGSGRWLRAFGAVRSVAVPILDSRGTVRAVFSVALGEGSLSEEALSERVRAAALGLASSLGLDARPPALDND